MNKTHKNAILYCKREIEKVGKNNPFRCKREWDISRGRLLNSVDLSCFRDDSGNHQNSENNQNITAVGLEFESTPKNRWKSNKQIISNDLDLKEFSRLHKNSKTFHLHVDEVEKIDFEKELSIKKKSSFVKLSSRGFRI